jgi:hypothetical protein
MILDDAVVECSPRMLPRVGGNKDGTCTPSAAFSKARKTSESETNDLGNFKFAPLLFDPFLVVVFEVVVVIFYAKASDVGGDKSGEISIDFPSLRVLITLERERRERTTKTCRCGRYKEERGDEDERLFFLVCSFASVLS